MKNNKARLFACILACTMGLICTTGCSKSDEEDTDTASVTTAAGDSDTADEGGVEVIATDENGAEITTTTATDENGNVITDAAAGGDVTTLNSSEIEEELKHPMTFDLAMDVDDSGSSSVNADVPRSNDADTTTTAAGEKKAATTTVVTVTDTAGNAVKGDDGKVVTSVVETNGDAGEYTADIKSFQAYWLDMSLSKDIVCNGDFIDVTFRIKDDAPDGVYDLSVGDSDWANWDAETVYADYVPGSVTVGENATAATPGTATSNFCITSGTAAGKQGDEVTVHFDMSNNPGIVALIFRFEYDANALEIVDAYVGDDCADYIEMSEA